MLLSLQADMWKILKGLGSPIVRTSLTGSEDFEPILDESTLEELLASPLHIRTLKIKLSQEQGSS